VAQLLVRKIPDAVMQEIRTAAQSEGVSMEEFARRVLTRQAESRSRWLEFGEWSRRFTESQPKRPKSAPSTTDMIRKARGR